LFLALLRGKPERIYWFLAICIPNKIVTDIIGTILIVAIFSIPYILYIIWGGILIGNSSIQMHVGFAILFLTIMFHSLLLSLLWWWGRKWRITKMAIVLALVSVVFLFAYLLAVIFLPSRFTYTGTTLIFMSMSFVFASLAHFEIDDLWNQISMSLFT